MPESTTVAAPAPPPPAATPITGELGTQKINLKPSFVPPAPAANEKAPISAAAAAAVAATTDATKDAAKFAEAKPEPPKVDPAPAVDTAKNDAEASDIAKALADLNRETRSARGAREKAETELAKLGEKVVAAEKWEKATGLLKGKNYIEGLKALDPDLSVDDAILTLIAQADAQDAKPLSQADIERIAAEKYAAEKKSDEEKAAAANAQKLTQAQQSYVNACAQEFSPEKFPLVAALGVSDAQINEFAEASFAADRSVPLAEDALAHFEKQFEARLKKAGWTKAEIAAAKQEQIAAATQADAPAAKPASGAIVGVAASDTGGAPGIPEKPMSLAEKVKARRNAIIQAAQAR
jgi:hypothetical protein